MGNVYHCSYCNSNLPVEEMKKMSQKNKAFIHEEKAEEGIGSKQCSREAVNYECRQCGVQVVSDIHTVATFCLYCHSSNIIVSRLVGEHEPNKVIPLTEEEAKKAFRKWTTTVSFLLDDFTNVNHLSKISPLFAPFWVYTMRVQFRLKGFGIIQTKWQSRGYSYTEEITIEWSNRQGCRKITYR